VKKELIARLARRANFEWSQKEKYWVKNAVAGTSFGAAGAMSILGQVFGITAVAHSSGGMILTGAAGYISGTLVAGSIVWLVWPLLILVGFIAFFWNNIKRLSAPSVGAFVAAFDWFIRRLYFWRNKG
jgi:hypothetical protein